MKRAGLLFVAVVVLCCGAAGPVGAAGPADVVPQDAILYVELGPAAAQQILGFLALPPVAGMVQPGLAGPFSYVDAALKVPPGTAAEAAPHLEGLAFALVGEEPLIILAFDEPTWPRRLLRGMEEEAGGLFSLGDPGSAAAVSGALLLVGTRDTCRLAVAPTAPSLAQAPAFAQAWQRADGVQAWAYATMPSLLDMVVAQMSPRESKEFGAFISLSGLDEAEFLVASAGPEGHAELVLHFKNEAAWLLEALPETPLQAAGHVPAGTAAAVALNWGDAGALIGHIRDFVTQMGAAAGAGGGPDPFAQMEVMLGVPPDELAGTLGSGLCVYLMAGPEDGMIDRQDWTVVVPLTDPEGFEAVLGRMCQNALGMPLPQVDYEGTDMLRLPMAPAFLKVTGDVLVASGSPQNVKRYVDWRSGAARESLLAELGDQPLAAMVRLDLGRLLTSYPASRSGTKVMLTLAREANDLKLAFGAEDFDPSRFYAEYMQGYSAVMFGMLMPALSRAREEAQKSSGRSNLHNIGLGLAAYTVDYQRYPESLAEVVDEAFVKAEMLLDPSDPGPVPAGDAGLRTSYEFVGSVPLNLPAATIIVYTRKGVHRDGRNVLHVDGSVLWVSEWELQQPGDPYKSLPWSYEAVVKAYGDALTPERDAELRRFYEIED